MKWKEFVADYLTFTRKERMGIITIIFLVIAIFFLPEFMPKANSTKPLNSDTAWIAALKKLEQKESFSSQQGHTNEDDNSTGYQYDRSKNNYQHQSKGELFYFDPNTLSAEGWKKLGLRDKTITTILNYRVKEDNSENPKTCKEFMAYFPMNMKKSPYIRIEPESETNRYKNYTEKSPVENPPLKTYSPRYAVIDINVADTTAFITLPGIGSKLATRIINFRDKLGGFYSINQVGETFGLPDSTFQKIKQYLKLENISVKKININTATVDELKAHPYIKYSLANPIVAYRTQHGPFAKVEDIKKVMTVTDEIYAKVVAYLSVQ